jgi:hypothetical protein
MRLDPSRAVKATVLAIWTAVFAWLWIRGATIYVGPRTSWVVPFGTVALAGCTVLAVLGAFGDQTAARRPSLRELCGYAVLLAPVVAVVVVDSPQLGANVANRKAGVELSVDDLPSGNGALDLMTFVVASQDPAVAKQLGLDRGGRRVAFPGILTKRGAAMVDVTRFEI